MYINNDFESNFDELKNELFGLNNSKEIIKICLKFCADYYEAESCNFIVMDLSMKIWYLLWVYYSDSHYKYIRNYEVSSVILFQFWKDKLDKGEIVYLDQNDINVELNDLLKKYKYKTLLAAPFKSNPSGFVVVQNPKKNIEGKNFLWLITYIIFASVKENKYLERLHNMIHPKDIKNANDILIHLFGRFEVHTIKGCLTAKDINSLKIIALIELFVLNKNEHLPTNEIWYSLWPNECSNNAGANVKSLISRANGLFHRIIDERLFVSSEYGYGFNSNLNIITDIDLMRIYWLNYHDSVSTQGKIEPLIEYIELYKGKLFGDFSFIEEEFYYDSEYRGIINELLPLFYKSKEYLNVIKYASDSIKICPYNREAYYWLILSLKNQKKYMMVKSNMNLARNNLSDEDYEILSNMFKDQK